MNKCAEWIEDILGAAKEAPDATAIHMLESCGKGCAARKNAVTAIRQLKTAAAECKTRADYIAFLRKVISINITEAEDSIILHLGKKACSCPMIPQISQNTDMLCECTKGHEKTVWSEFFGKPVEVEIVESLLRGGNDCVIKIKI